MEATGQLDKKTAEAIQTKIIEKSVLEKMITTTVSIKINGEIKEIQAVCCLYFCVKQTLVQL